MNSSRHFPFLATLLLLCGCPSESTNAGGGGAGQTGPQCKVDADCPKGECETAKCESDSCALTPLEEGFVLDIQVGGDCQSEVCDGSGKTKLIVATDDAPISGPCVTFSCDGNKIAGEFNVGAVCGDNNDGFCLPNPQGEAVLAARVVETLAGR